MVDSRPLTIALVAGETSGEQQKNESHTSG